LDEQGAMACRKKGYTLETEVEGLIPGHGKVVVGTSAIMS